MRMIARAALFIFGLRPSPNQLERRIAFLVAEFREMYPWLSPADAAWFAWRSVDVGDQAAQRAKAAASK